MAGDREKSKTIDAAEWQRIREVELEKQKNPRVESRKGDHLLRKGDYARIETAASSGEQFCSTEYFLAGPILFAGTVVHCGRSS
jgi:hypothetical protein